MDVQTHKPAQLRDLQVEQMRKQVLVILGPRVVSGPGLTDKSYPGDNRLIGPESPYRRPGLAPRCRLILSWGWRRSQWSGCSPVKRVRELGSERRKTVRSLSGASDGYLRGALVSTRGLRGRNPWCASCHPRVEAASWIATFLRDKR